MYHFSIMGFCPDSVTKVMYLCWRKRGKDYSTRWHVHILFLCRPNLITSKVQDKAVHCAKSFFNQSHHAGSMLPEKQQEQTPHTQMEEFIKIFNSPMLLLDGSAGQGSLHTTNLQLCGCFYSSFRIHLMSVIPFCKVTKKKHYNAMTFLSKGLVHPLKHILTRTSSTMQISFTCPGFEISASNTIQWR